jgi:phage terminase large subunit
MEEYGFDKSWKIVADGARPDQIAELRSEGYNIVAGQKGKGSIVAGIDLMKRFPICIDRGSSPVQIEFEQYAWKKHPTGYQMAEPEDKYNHAIDSVRYWCMNELSGWQPVGHHSRATAVAGRRKRRY